MEGEEERSLRKDKVLGFIEQIRKANGELVLLPARKSVLGEPFYIAVRGGQDPVEPQIDYLIVDLFAKRGEEFVPIGIYDWEITEDKAVGNKQRHGHLPALNQAQENADRYWSTGEAFHLIDIDFLGYAFSLGGLKGMSQLREAGVIKDEAQWSEPIYQGRGLGSLLIAVSLLALEKQGIKTVDLGSLTPMAKRAWDGFGRKERQIIPLEELIGQDKIVETIEKFVD